MTSHVMDNGRIIGSSMHGGGDKRDVDTNSFMQVDLELPDVEPDRDASIVDEVPTKRNRNEGEKGSAETKKVDQVSMDEDIEDEYELDQDTMN